MISKEPIVFKPFNISEGASKYQSRLPHWRQQGTTYFVTFRLADSIPEAIFEQWEDEKAEWLLKNGISKTPPIKTEDIPEEFRFPFKREFNKKLNEYLDGCHGSCILRQVEHREILIEKMEASRSVIGDYVIMPNHVHLLITVVLDQSPLEKSLGKIKGGSSFQINRKTGQSGALWQRDSFDRIVRNAKTLDRYRAYIEDNPAKARVTPTEYSYHQGHYIASALADESLGTASCTENIG